MTENQRENEATIRSSSDPAEEYQMGNKRRGLALIFNQEHFFYLLDLPERRGTNVDRDSLERSIAPGLQSFTSVHQRVPKTCDRGTVVSDFTVVKVVPTASTTEEMVVDFRKNPMTVSPVVDLNFEVRCYDNLKQEAVLEKITKAAEEDHSDADCFLLAFLSHGEDNHVYCYDGKISILYMMSMFKGDKCQELVGKPKIFIIQACRGKEFDVAVTVTEASTTETEEKMFVDASTIQTLPAGADFIMCYSVAQGYFSFREKKNGSWYIQDLCQLLQKYGDSLEFTELLTQVNRKVSLRNIPTPCPPRFIGKKQMPCFASMLTKKLYFRPKK